MPSQVTDPTKIKLAGVHRVILVDANGKKGATVAAAAARGFQGWHPDDNSETFRITDPITPVKQIVNPDNQ